MIEIVNGVEIEHKLRPPVDYAHKPAGDVHMEHAGPSGSLVLFNMYAPDGRPFEILDKDENALALVTSEALLAGRPAS